jgi:hypothetical protein
MRSALVAILFLAACGAPSGAERSGCGPDRRDAEVVVTRPGGIRERPIAIDCMHEVSVRRIRVGFTLPGGPDCLQLSRVELAESADSVAVFLIGAVNDDPAAGACPDDATMAVTEVDLAAPVDDRVLLDGSDRDGG